MSRTKKTLTAVLSGRSDSNIAYHDLCSLLENLGFFYRTNGSHRIYHHALLIDTITIQPKMAKAKKYQVKQVRDFLKLNSVALGIAGEGQ